jgi:hypothetical protein
MLPQIRVQLGNRFLAVSKVATWIALAAEMEKQKLSTCLPRSLEIMTICMIQLMLYLFLILEVWRGSLIFEPHAISKDAATWIVAADEMESWREHVFRAWQYAHMHGSQCVPHLPPLGTLTRTFAIEAHAFWVVQTTRSMGTLTLQFPVPSMPKTTIDWNFWCNRSKRGLPSRQRWSHFLYLSQEKRNTSGIYMALLPFLDPALVGFLKNDGPSA